MTTLSASVASISSRLDPLSQSALDSRITFLRETKPEAIFRDANATLTSFGFYEDVIREESQVEHYFPQNAELPATPRQDLRQEIIRITGFNKLLKSRPEDMERQLKALARKGISEQHRGAIWKLCLSRNTKGTDERTCRDRYQALLQKEIDERTVDQINKDIDRTMPQLAFFSSSEQLESLFCILKAYAASNPRISYCQGMGFIAAVFLYYMPEFDAFYCFSKFMQQYKSLYDPTMIGTRRKCQLIFEVLRLTDPGIHDYLLSIDLEPVTFASWIMTIFFYSLDFHVAIRVFDVFVSEGDKALIRAAIALIRRAASGKRFELPHGVPLNGEAHAARFQAWAENNVFRNGISILGMPHDEAFIKLNEIGYAVKNGDSLVKEMLRVRFMTSEMESLQSKINNKIK